MLTLSSLFHRKTTPDDVVEVPASERRRFKRVKAPVLYRSERLRYLARPAEDIGMGGVRIWSDEKLHVGERLRIDLILPEGEPVRALVQVAWHQALPDDAPARWELGLQMLELNKDDLDRLQAVLAE